MGLVVVLRDWIRRSVALCRFLPVGVRVVLGLLVRRWDSWRRRWRERSFFRESVAVSGEEREVVGFEGFEGFEVVEGGLDVWRFC